MAHWIRVGANQSLGAYEVFRASGLSDDPPWPKTEFHIIVQIAFKNRLIKSLDHPERRRLRGKLCSDADANSGVSGNLARGL